MLKSPFNRHDSKVAIYLQKFAQLRDILRTESAIVTEITVFQMVAKLDNILVEIKEICKYDL
jgi:hypothetical protein